MLHLTQIYSLLIFDDFKNKRRPISA